MADGYRAVLAIAAADDSEPSWGEVTTALRTAFTAAGLDWKAAEHRRAYPGLLLFALPATAGRLAGAFVESLTVALRELPRPPQLRLGLASGMCHHDGHGWYGDPVSTARRLAASAGHDAAPALTLAVADDVYRRALDGEARGAFREEIDPGSAGSYWVRATMRDVDVEPGPPSVVAEVARRTARGSPARLLAEVIDEVARPVGEFVDELPVLLSPGVAPHDVLVWMYEALGVDAPMLLDDDRGRRLLSGLVRCYRQRGTARGLAALIELRYGVGVEIVDPRGTTWSAVPTTPMRPPPATVTVLLDTDEPLAGLDEVIQSALPATVGYRVARRPGRSAEPRAGNR